MCADASLRSLFLNIWHAPLLVLMLKCLSVFAFNKVKGISRWILETLAALQRCLQDAANIQCANVITRNESTVWLLFSSPPPFQPRESSNFPQHERHSRDQVDFSAVRGDLTFPSATGVHSGIKCKQRALGPPQPSPHPPISLKSPTLLVWISVFHLHHVLNCCPCYGSWRL